MAGTLLGQGATADLLAYTRPGWAVKLFHSGSSSQTVCRERDMQARVCKLARLQGSDAPPPMLCVPAVDELLEEQDGRFGFALEWIDAPTLLALPIDDERKLSQLIALQHRIHCLPGKGFTPRKQRLRSNLLQAPLPETLRNELLHRLDALPDGDSLCHGDFHPLNVLVRGDENWVIDWADVNCGTPEADACRSWCLLLSFSAAAAQRYEAAWDKDFQAWKAVTLGGRMAEQGAPQAVLREALEHCL